MMVHAKCDLEYLVTSASHERYEFVYIQQVDLLDVMKDSIDIRWSDVHNDLKSTKVKLLNQTELFRSSEFASITLPLCFCHGGRKGHSCKILHRASFAFVQFIEHRESTFGHWWMLHFSHTESPSRRSSLRGSKHHAAKLEKILDLTASILQWPSRLIRWLMWAPYIILLSSTKEVQKKARHCPIQSKLKPRILIMNSLLLSVRRRVCSSSYYYYRYMMMCPLV